MKAKKSKPFSNSFENPVHAQAKKSGKSKREVGPSDCFPPLERCLFRRRTICRVGTAVKRRNRCYPTDRWTHCSIRLLISSNRRP